MSTKVLIVDDAVFMRTVLKKMLTEEGNFEVVGEASNGVEAIQKAKELQPDIITLDITMPEMDGVTALPEIIKVSPNSKVIMCSAMGQQPMVIDSIKNGAKDFIVKPFQKTRVIQAIENVLK
ncbi:two-component system chemotaxis response regulator CheY [Natranaerovirga hydrolytica]|uniref:Stage 0 sporulation protein A homolog n=1 Tax=Natranaerovirga hydrolytica TaxID=680378 RepID=A0A4R1MYS6_9FIRM|nr:response regulator [Natranaerovirga hydrolytica]TCK98396.1 two-component system chemotaxis response regulator CheY [Natranaerovirga hydrolytica]